MKTRQRAAFAVLGLVCILLLAVCISIGSIPVPADALVRILTGRSDHALLRDIVLRLRMPRAVAAALLGGALSLSGYLLQTYFHNPIAGPFILGISSGAKLAVAGMMILLMRTGLYASSWLSMAAAFAGAMLSMGFVLLMARLVNRPSILLISGVMIGYICSAVTDLLVTFASDADIVNLHNWSRGSFSGLTWAHVGMLLPVILPALAGCILLAKPMSAYQYGEEYARSVGVPVRLFRTGLVLLSSMLAACVTALAGPVSFVGVAVPQLTKRLLKTEQPLLMIPGCFLYGAAFCMLSDLLARTLLTPTELSISTITSIFGAPVVLLVLMRRRREQS